MEDFSPEAYFDAALILNDAPQSVLPISIVEMHLFSYLTCILALFQGKPIGDWGYSYAITSEGFPFSAQFEIARNRLISLGLAELNENGLIERNFGALQIESSTLLELGSWGGVRRPLLRTATECALALPVSSIRYAIGRSPGVSSALDLGQRRKLLDPDDIELIYEEYKIVSSVLGESAGDMLSPSVIWLSARILRDQDQSRGV